MLDASGTTRSEPAFRIDARRGRPPQPRARSSADTHRPCGLMPAPAAARAPSSSFRPLVGCEAREQREGDQV